MSLRSCADAPASPAVCRIDARLIARVEKIMYKSVTVRVIHG